MTMQIPPVVYDDCNQYDYFTIRLIALMKKTMLLMGDKAKSIIVDGAEYFDDVEEHPGYCRITDLQNMGLEYDLWPRMSDAAKKIRFCLMIGEHGKQVIGIY